MVNARPSVIRPLSIFLIFAIAGCAEKFEPVDDPDGNAPSVHTIRQQEALRRKLPFEDQRDFDEQRRGFVATPDYRRITDESGDLVWDIGQYDFLLTGEEFDSIHPSLQRQATLNMNYGLYEVVPGKIYQVRGFDLANMTLVKGDTGWILFDVLLVKETAAAALAFANRELGERPVVAIVYSHSHADHFGGARGVVDESDVLQGKTDILAPRGFMEHAAQPHQDLRRCPDPTPCPEPRPAALTRQEHPDRSDRP